MSAKKPAKSVSQRAIAFLLILQTMLIGVNAENRIRKAIITRLKSTADLKAASTQTA
ncbi:hypothetical protein [Nostoc sp.]|uniref:hypothetical protein n=1 Tax=Nostoc sp. TaxID=1180 RepID=UPI002FF531A0